MYGDDSEFGQVRKIRNVLFQCKGLSIMERIEYYLMSDLRQFFDNILLTLQITELVFQRL